jgi:hypothetical protein
VQALGLCCLGVSPQPGVRVRVRASESEVPVPPGRRTKVTAHLLPQAAHEYHPSHDHAAADLDSEQTLLTVTGSVTVLLGT